jgi:hypothetical protein
MTRTSSIADILGLNDSPRRETHRNRKGVMIYYHKTGGEIQISTNDEYNKNRGYFNPRGMSATKNCCAPTHA